MRLGSLLVSLALFAGAVNAQDCAPVDFLTMPLPVGGDPVASALEAAYPGLALDRAAGIVTLTDGAVLPFEPPRPVGPADRLNDATIGDMFVYIYPLDFNLTRRRTPFEDPGRLRNEALFRALYFDSKAAVRQSLDRVRFSGQRVSAGFLATEKHCVDVQLDAALNEIEALGPQFERFLDDAGGSFNWRKIAGTDRLSVHSFGIAVDFNAKLGGYWRWSGAAEGQALDFNNNFPPEVVQAMERRGFIWGGKWHHFDGMHFEFRPELILFARLVAAG